MFFFQFWQDWVFVNLFLLHGLHLQLHISGRKIIGKGFDEIQERFLFLLFSATGKPVP